MLSLPEVSDFFAKLIQRVAPKSYQQALGEVYVTAKFLENFSGDQANVTRTNHIMWAMGTEFRYQYAVSWFRQIDKFIHYVTWYCPLYLNAVYFFTYSLSLLL
ncbi:putative L-glutamate gamma-semialdehyde dehydrogenase [Helianthus debilis subsp. tardiflorus]